MPEIRRAQYVAYFHSKHLDEERFTAPAMRQWFIDAGLAAPNATRLARAMISSPDFLRVGSNEFRLSAKSFDDLDEGLRGLNEKGDDVHVSTDEILLADLYENSRGYLRSLGRQINKCYAENLFDACAILMRRLLEVLLILAFREIGGETAIEQDGVHVSLEKIVAVAKQSQKLKLSRNTKTTLDDFRTLGNFAAHKIEYSTRRGDIDSVRVEYRGAIEELMYKAGVAK
jgi:hypothetical protein